VRIACAQLEPTIGEVLANVENACDAISQAARSGASVVVLPELTTTGYVFESREEAFALSEAVPNGPASSQFLSIARALNIYVVVGMTERDGDRLFNTSAVFGPTKFVGRFRKVHLWDRENLVFDPGDLGFPLFDTPVGRIGTFICYDGWFPESYRACVLAGADLICIPTNWVPIPGQDPTEPAMATYLCMASAHVNGVVVAAADRVGIERGQEFIGQSVIINYTGWPLAGPASSVKTEMLTADVDLKAAREARTWNAFNNPVRDRRPDSYGATMQGSG
jgi:N-carbamoylputrescine amidase